MMTELGIIERRDGLTASPAPASSWAKRCRAVALEGATQRPETDDRRELSSEGEMSEDQRRTEPERDRRKHVQGGSDPDDARAASDQ